MIQAENLSKSFGQLKAVQHLSFQVPKGTITGFLGPNGAGKTTTFKLLLGLLRPDSGRVWLCGEELGSFPGESLRRQISYLPQDPVFPKELTGMEVLTMVGENYGLSKPRLRAEELLTLFQLEEAATRKVGVYSRGMKQKLGLAGALLPKPRLLLLDEPVSALDPEGREQGLKILTELARETTIFLSSHILADIQRMAQRVLVIWQGEKLVEEELGGLISRYSRDYYRLEIAAGSLDKARELLMADGAVGELKAETNGFLLTVLPGKLQHFRKSTLSALLAEGVELVSFMPQEPSLEEIFLEIVGEGEKNGLGV